MDLVEIKSYDIRYYAGGKRMNSTWQVTHIVCYGINGDIIADAHFYPDYLEVPDNDWRSGNIANLVFRLQDFSNVVDVLRNEKPVYLQYFDGVEIGGIFTGSEPIGEGEITRRTVS
jgi:hypothetical protein